MSLKGLDKADRVVYVGTFTRLLFTSLRLGFIVAPFNLAKAFANMISLTTSHPSILEQAVLTDFVKEGHLDRHIRRIRGVYLKKREVFTGIVQKELADYVEIQEADAGMNLLAQLKKGLRGVEVAQAAYRRGIQISPLSEFCFKCKMPEGILLGFTLIDEQEMKSGILKLKSVLSDLVVRK